MNNQIRVRFPPSPTGNLHIGNARTALFNYLFCKHVGGTFVFRIEDTDFARSTEAFMQNEIDAMNWLSIHWDEGIIVGGDYGPYRQSERLLIYKRYVQQLLNEGKAYRCFCTPEQIEADRNNEDSGAISGKYSGRCRNIQESEIKLNLEMGKPYVIRYKLPETTKDILIHDLIRGDMVFQSDHLDDFVLVRSDGIPTYNFAVTIDDATMDITHIIRGEDHLFGNTPRQILLYQDLHFHLPQFAHLPMILGPDKTKLSKRHGAFAVTDYKEMGFLSDSVVNYMALLGWSPKSDEEIFSMDELIEKFDLSHVNVSPAVFDYEKLKWFNQQHMKRKSVSFLMEEVKPILAKNEAAQQWSEKNRDIMEITLDSLRRHLVTLQDFPRYIETFASYKELDFDNCIEEVKNSLSLFVAIHDGIDHLSRWNSQDIADLIQHTGKQLQLKGKQLYHPLRLALTKEEQGPDLPVIMLVMGKEAVQYRLAAWSNIIRNQVNSEEGGNHGD